jgi:hypothetical protein
MFKAVVSVILEHATGNDRTSRGAITRPVDDIITSIMNRRLSKLQGLRSYLRRYCCALGLASGNTMTVINLDPNKDGSEPLRSPITRLDQQQRLVIGGWPPSIERSCRVTERCLETCSGTMTYSDDQGGLLMTSFNDGRFHKPVDPADDCNHYGWAQPCARAGKSITTEYEAGIARLVPSRAALLRSLEAREPLTHYALCQRDVQELLASLLWIHLSPAVFSAVAANALQQSLITEPVTRLLELLLYSRFTYTSHHTSTCNRQPELPDETL